MEAADASADHGKQVFAPLPGIMCARTWNGIYSVHRARLTLCTGAPSNRQAFATLLGMDDASRVRKRSFSPLFLV